MSIVRMMGVSAPIVLAGALAATASPKLGISEENFDFGCVPQNAKVSHVYWLKSEGTDTVKIANVVPGCGCTKAPLEKNILGPGDSTRLEVTFDTRSYSGLVTKRPTIQFSDGTPDAHITFNCNVAVRPDSTYPIIISPYKLDLTQFGEKVRSEVKFSIANASDSDLTITLVSQPTGLATVALPKMVKAGKSAEGTLKLTKEGMEADFEKAITLQVSDAKNSRFTIPLKRTMRKPGDVQVEPAVPAAGTGH
jgi:hypothetical protein